MKQNIFIKALCFALCVVTLCACLTSCVCIPSKNSSIKYSVNNKKVAVESENFTITGGMMSYYFYQTYNEFLNQYGTIISYMGLDNSQSLKEQFAPSEDGDQTWFEYFMDPTLEQVKILLVYCEAAKNDGVQLSDEDHQDIDRSIDALIDSAKNNDYTVSEYISAMYGLGVTKDDVIAAMELSLLAQKYGEQLQAELGEDYDSWYDVNEGKYNITYNYDVINNIDA